MQEALEKELEEVETKAKAGNATGDQKMEGADEQDEDAASETGSEDLEADSSDDEEEEDEDEGEGADEDVEMGEGDEKAATKSATNGTVHKPEVMAH